MISANQPSNGDYYFTVVKAEDSEFSTVKDQFNQVIAPLYGDQTQALEKIASGVDRSCELLSDTNKIAVGIIVYKKEPTEEFSSHGLRQALELKTLFVINAQEQSGKGIGTKLIDRIKEIASHEKFESIAVTVSNAKSESISFFERKEFKVFHRYDEGKYKEGEIELLYGHIKS